MRTRESHDTVWVCVDCYFAHHGLRDEDGESPDKEPLCLIPADAEVTAGLLAEEHDVDCPVWLGDPDRPDVPAAEECDCEQRDFSWHPCQGCGSHLGGSREALTVWTQERSEDGQ